MSFLELSFGNVEGGFCQCERCTPTAFCLIRLFFILSLFFSFLFFSFFFLFPKFFEKNLENQMMCYCPITFFLVTYHLGTKLVEKKNWET